MSLPKVYIGTGYSGELEFSDCCNIINKQKRVNITHEIFPTEDDWMETFQVMYNKWEEIKHDYDLFIQVDADIILHNEVVVDYICKKLIPTEFNHAIFPLYDFLSDAPIWGLNCYKPTVAFQKLTDKHRFDMQYKNYRRLETNITDNTVGTHATCPSILTAFHYGWHRQLKSSVSPGQKHILSNLYKAAKETNDEFRKHAMCGSYHALEYSYKTGDHSAIGYKNPKFLEYFSIYEKSL